MDGEASGSESDNTIFYGRLNSAKKLLDTLQCLLPASTSSKSTDVEVKCHPASGVRFTTVIPGILLSTVKFPASCFVGFQATSARVRLNLSLLTDCLSLPSSDRPIPVTLAVTRESMRVTLDDETSHNTDCILCTMEDGCSAFDAMRSIPQSNIVSSAIMSSEILRDAISELHYGGSEHVILKVSPQVPRMVLKSSSLGRKGIVVEFPDPLEPTQDCFDEFHCETTIQVTYRLDFLTRIAKTLALSNVAKISISDLGALSVVCKMNNSNNFNSDTSACFVEFLVLAMEVENADDEVDEDRDEEMADE